MVNLLSIYLLCVQFVVQLPVVWVSDDSTWFVQTARDQDLFIGAVQVHGHNDVTSGVGVKQFVVDWVHL